MIDLHVHTSRCGHATGSIEDYVQRALEVGVRTLGFADHLPLPDGFPSGYAMTWPELPSYVSDVQAVADRVRESDGLEVLVGIEADWIGGHESLVAGALRAHPFDYVLGSVHFIDGWAFDDPERIDEYESWSIDELWSRYFADLASAASTGLFDAMAHPDLIKKFATYPDVDPEPLYRKTASVLAECGVAIEVNTAGLRKPCAELYPSAGLLAACRSRGVAATMGSDAHDASDVGAGLSRAREALKEAGYRSVLVWRGRHPKEVAL